MSSVSPVRNRPRFQVVRPPSQLGGSVPRSPVSIVRLTTCFSEGSERKKAPSVQGSSGSAQASSAGVGVRLASA